MRSLVPMKTMHARTWGLITVISLARGTHPRGIVRIDTSRSCIPIRALYWACIWVSADSTKKQNRDHRTPSTMSREFAQVAHQAHLTISVRRPPKNFRERFKRRGLGCF
jgi:hypothetical protein